MQAHPTKIGPKLPFHLPLHPVGQTAPLPTGALDGALRFFVHITAAHGVIAIAHGDRGLGTGDWGLSLVPCPPSPVPYQPLGKAIPICLVHVHQIGRTQLLRRINRLTQPTLLNRRRTIPLNHRLFHIGRRLLHLFFVGRIAFCSHS